MDGPVYAQNIDTGEIKRFDSILVASRFLDVPASLLKEKIDIESRIYRWKLYQSKDNIKQKIASLQELLNYMASFETVYSTKSTLVDFSKENVFKMKLSEFSISNPTINILFNEGIITIQNLVAYPRSYLQSIRGLGNQRLKELDSLLSKLHLCFSPETQDVLSHLPLSPRLEKVRNLLTSRPIVSTLCYNKLRLAGFKTYAQIVQNSRERLISHFGLKSVIEEIDTLVESHGLNYEMDLSPYELDNI